MILLFHIKGRSRAYKHPPSNRISISDGGGRAYKHPPFNIRGGRIGSPQITRCLRQWPIFFLLANSPLCKIIVVTNIQINF